MAFETYDMWTRCHTHVEVAKSNHEFRLTQECPRGHGPKITAMELMEICLGCPACIPMERKSPLPQPEKCPKQKDQNPLPVDRPVEEKPKMPAKSPPIQTKKLPPQVGKKPPMAGRKPPPRTVTFPDGAIFRVDAIELAKSLPDESIDIVIFDPAYESLEKHRKIGTTTRLKQSKASSNAWFETFPNRRYFALLVEMYRAMKPGTFLYMFCDEEMRDLVCCGFSPQTGEVLLEGLEEAEPPLIAAGFKYWKAVVWDKVHAGMGYHFRAQHEFILMAEKVVAKGKHRQLTDKKLGDVLSRARLKGKQYYPTEKPIELIEDLLLPSSSEGDRVFDPFCGSGVVGQACRKHGRHFILGDLLPDEAIKRLS